MEQDLDGRRGPLVCESVERVFSDLRVRTRGSGEY
jgi:hypothetical protein